MLAPDSLTPEDEKLLVDALDQLSPTGIANICNTIVGAELPFEHFVDEALPIVKKNLKSFDLTEIGEVLIAFASFSPDVELFEYAEQIIKERKSELSPNSVLILGQAFAHTSNGTSDLVELFDKTVGKNMSKVTADMISPLLAMFSSFDNVREKIFIAFHRKIKNHKNELSLAEKCHILGVYGRK